MQYINYRENRRSNIVAGGRNGVLADAAVGFAVRGDLKYKF